MSDIILDCHLIHVTLNNLEEGTLNYAALPYVWRDVSQKRRILLDGHMFEITQNLHDAIEALMGSKWTCVDIREEGEIEVEAPMLLWADAVCINQQDGVEKSLQIQMMRDIYREAYAMFIRLGASSEGSDTVLGMAEQFGSPVRPLVDFKAKL